MAERHAGVLLQGGNAGHHGQAIAGHRRFGPVHQSVARSADSLLF